MRLLITLVFFLAASSATALADGGYYESGGCDGSLLLGAGFIVYDAVKMKTDPAYRARAEELRRKK